MAPRDRAQLNPQLVTITIRGLGGTLERIARLDYDLLEDLAAPEPETKPTDTDLPAGLSPDPDPYGIDLRGPHTTIRSADRATLGGLADLDPRDRALYRALLHTTLDNLDRTEPTQTVIRAGNR